MPKVVELRQLAGELWARVELPDLGHKVTLWTDEEILEFEQNVRREVAEEIIRDD
jgi:hypothetical protein